MQEDIKYRVYDGTNLWIQYDINAKDYGIKNLNIEGPFKYATFTIGTDIIETIKPGQTFNIIRRYNYLFYECNIKIFFDKKHININETGLNKFPKHNIYYEKEFNASI
jgi:hypothetical protein